MSAEDLDNYETDAELALYKEYRDVIKLFTYVVETERRFYLANKVDFNVRSAGQDVYFDVQLTDAWVWDIYRSSRFVKACFLAKHALLGESEAERQRNFFRLLFSLSFPLGAVLNPDSTYERTIYSSCMNLSKKSYCYISENGDVPHLVRIADFNLDVNSLFVGPLLEEEATKAQSLLPL